MESSEIVFQDWKSLDKLRVSSGLIYWYLPIGYLSGVLAFSYQERVTDKTVEIQLVAIITTLFTVSFLALFLWLQTRTTKRNQTWPAVHLTFLIVGSVRGIIINFLESWFSLESGLSLMNRVVVSTGSTLFWLSFLSVLIGSHDEFRARYRKLLSRMMLERSVGLTDENLKEQLRQVEKSLQTIEIQNTNSKPESKLLLDLASEVQLRIEESIRPISKRLWISSVQDYPKVGFLPSLHQSIRHFNYSTIVVSILVLIISMSTLVTFMPFTEAIGRTLITISCISVFTQVFSFVKSHVFFNPLFQSIMQLVFLSLVPILLGNVVFSTSHFQINNPISLTVYLVLPTLLIGSSFFNTLKHDRLDLLTRIELNLFEFNDQNLQAKQAASYLHNSLQSELLAISKRLEHAAENEVDFDARPVLERLGALINRSISNDFQDFYGNPQSRLGQVIENWRGLISIKIENPEILLRYPDKAVLGVQLIEELASNLAKHSDASQIEIQCSERQGYIYLEVEYPKYLETNSDLGLGSDLLNLLRAEDETESDSTANGKLRFEI